MIQGVKCSARWQTSHTKVYSQSWKWSKLITDLAFCLLPRRPPFQTQTTYCLPCSIPKHTLQKRDPPGMSDTAVNSNTSLYTMWPKVCGHLTLKSGVHRTIVTMYPAFCLILPPSGGGNLDNILKQQHGDDLCTYCISRYDLGFVGIEENAPWSSRAMAHLEVMHMWMTWSSWTCRGQTSWTPV